MAKDYARNKTAKKSNATKGNGMMWLFSLGLICLFVLGLFYLKEQKLRLDMADAQQVNIPEQPKQKPTGAPLHSRTHNPKPVLNPANNNQTNLDFYNLLPKTAVPANQSSTQALPPVQTVPLPPLANTSATTYNLQLGVFNDYGAADELKAEVTLQGFEAVISSFKKEGATFYRLTMGPFKSKAAALQQQQTLAQNQIKSTLEMTRKM